MVQVKMAEHYSVNRFWACSHLIQAHEGARTAIEEQRQIILYQYRCLRAARLGDAYPGAKESNFEAHCITL